MLQSTLYGGEKLNAFNTRHGSLQAPANSRRGNGSIKEQLRALKMTEANEVKGNKTFINQTLREERRRKSAFVTATDEEHRKLGIDGGELDDDGRSLRSPFEANADLTSRQSQASPMSRGFLG